VDSVTAPILLVDLSAVFWRTYHSCGNGHDAYTFTLEQLTEKIAVYPRMVICCEGKRPIRFEWAADYKANRPAKAEDAKESLRQIIRELEETPGIPVLTIEALEADDIIAALAVQSTEPVVIWSSDKDLAQLLTPTVNMLIDGKLFGVTDCVAKFGVRPEQMRDYLAIVGDSADNIAGCPGIGAKGAAALLQRFGTLGRAMAAPDEALGLKPKALEKFRAWDPALAIKLTTLITDAPIDINDLFPNQESEADMADMSKIISQRKGGPLKIVAYGPEGVGKAQPLDCEVLTPDGFKKIGTIVVGDQVIGADGKPCSVTGVFPQGKREVFRVTMTDGTFTRSCGEHLWATSRADDKTVKVRSLFRIKETLRRAVSGEHAGPEGTYPNHRIQLVKPVEFQGLGERPLHPYLLGALLGDGSLTRSSVEFHKPEPDVLTKLASLLPGDDTHSMLDSDSGLRIRRPTRNTGTSFTRQALEKLELVGTDSFSKFIPRAYLFAPVVERLELLRGLCDTDGSVVGGTRVEFSTTSIRLAADISFLGRSLGALVYSTLRTTQYSYKGEKRDGAESSRVMLFFPDGTVPVSSAKNLAKWRGPKAQSYRSIESIDSVGEEECVCIAVDAEDHLYVTDDFIVTHNTRFGAFSNKPIFLCAENGLSAPDLRDVPAFPTPDNWDDVLAAVNWLRTNEHPYRTLVIDSLDWLYKHVKAAIRQRDNMSDLEFDAYGRGEKFALDFWVNLNEAFDALQAAKGMHIIVLAHCATETFANPQGEDFARFQLALSKKAAERWKQWPDFLLFMSQEMFTKKDKNDKSAKAKGIIGGHRFFTSREAAYDAKNRINLPDAIEYDTANPWIAFAEAVKAAMPKPVVPAPAVVAAPADGAPSTAADNTVAA
jgi:5'-3' exonuclease